MNKKSRFETNRDSSLQALLINRQNPYSFYNFVNDPSQNKTSKVLELLKESIQETDTNHYSDNLIFSKMQRDMSFIDKKIIKCKRGLDSSDYSLQTKLHYRTLNQDGLIHTGQGDMIKGKNQMSL